MPPFCSPAFNIFLSPSPTLLFFSLHTAHFLLFYLFSPSSFTSFPASPFPFLPYCHSFLSYSYTSTGTCLFLIPLKCRLSLIFTHSIILSSFLLFLQSFVCPPSTFHLLPHSLFSSFPSRHFYIFTPSYDDLLYTVPLFAYRSPHASFHRLFPSLYSC